jgi:aspartate/methionine/tyrosine aminotransferase
MYILNEALVGLVPGSAFGNEECIRLSYASDLEQLETALQRIEKALKQLK